jgi:hypothetical protein
VWQHNTISEELAASPAHLALEPVTGYSPTDCRDLELGEAAETLQDLARQRSTASTMVSRVSGLGVPRVMQHACDYLQLDVQSSLEGKQRASLGDAVRVDEPAATLQII